MLDELIDRYGERAILTVRPYVLESGDTLRWVVEIDGAPDPDVDVRVAEHEERPDVMVMLLVYRGEEVEIARWKTTTDPHGPAAVVRPLAELR